jgi:farnesyl-diphosphate farnesyltransferase
VLQDDIKYCATVLSRVSRTFAPTIRLLPGVLNMHVTVAYLLCRIADTVEDSAALTIQEKQRLLHVYTQIFSQPESSAETEFLNGCSRLPVTTPDEELTHNLSVVLRVFSSFSAPMQKHIGKWVVEMSLGMRKFAQAAHKRRFTFLKSMKELDEYTYYVAGTVGYLLTELFTYYSRKITPLVKTRLDQFAESFGKGLQMVNIIRDMAADLKRGQSYIPDELLLKYRLTRENIFHADNADRAQQMFNELIENAVKHLDRALDYIQLIPKQETRIRLFCMLPLFWSLRTLQKIQENTLQLLGSDKIKISRGLLRREYLLALINQRSNRLIRWRYDRIRRKCTPTLVSA